MFNVTRIYPAPACIARGHYTKAVIPHLILLFSVLDGDRPF